MVRLNVITRAPFGGVQFHRAAKTRLPLMYRRNSAELKTPPKHRSAPTGPIAGSVRLRRSRGRLGRAPAGLLHVSNPHAHRPARHFSDGNGASRAFSSDGPAGASP